MPDTTSPLPAAIKDLLNDGCHADYVAAMEPWVEAGHVEATRELAEYFAALTGTRLGNRRERRRRDPDRAFALYKKLADQGDARAQEHVGYLYEHGTVVPTGHDMREAARYMRMAAGKGRPWACLKLGNYYRDGTVTGRPAYNEALACYLLAVHCAPNMAPLEDDPVKEALEQIGKLPGGQVAKFLQQSGLMPQFMAAAAGLLGMPSPPVPKDAVAPIPAPAPAA